MAAIVGRSAEFIISIALIGQWVTGHGSWKLLLSTIVVILVLASVGTWMTPDD